MTKIVKNTCFGGFGLSDEAEELYLKKAGCTLYRYTEAKERDFTDDNNNTEYRRALPGDYFTYIFKKDHGDTFTGWPDDGSYWCVYDIKRDDPLLVQVVEELGERANGSCASLAVVEIPDDVEWHISEYDGSEHVAENHRTW